MREIISLTVRLIEVGQRVYARKWSFLGIFAVTFFGSIGALEAMDLLPNTSQTATASEARDFTKKDNSQTVTPKTVFPELPVRVEIPTINLSATIANPTTTNTEVLDMELLKGAVRYPTSAKLGERGNVVLFGHSSYLPLVQNQSYKTFNGIQKLVEGDEIIVSSSSTEYRYRVRTVTQENTYEAIIPLSVPGSVLTLSTCDSFKTKTDRFVVVADFVESHSISI